MKDYPLNKIKLGFHKVVSVVPVVSVISFFSSYSSNGLIGTLFTHSRTSYATIRTI